MTANKICAWLAYSFVGAGTISTYLWFAESHGQDNDDIPSLEDIRGIDLIRTCDDCRDALTPTGSSGKGYSIECDLGDALPDQNRENLFKYQPIPGTRFVATAKGIGLSKPSLLGEDSYEISYGYVSITRKGQTLLLWKADDGEVPLISWSNKGRESALGTDKDGFVVIDFIAGTGFYHDSYRSWLGADPPKFFLANCKRIEISNLPQYEVISLRPGQSVED